MKPHAYALRCKCTIRMTYYLLKKINIEFNDDCPAKEYCELHERVARK